MEVIKNVLKDLELDPEMNQSQYVSGEDIYEFIIKNCYYNQIAENLEFFFIKLSAAAISEELFKQGQFGTVSFEQDDIIQLLQDREDREHHQLYNYYFDKQEFLECHSINGETYFFSKELKIKYDVLIKMFAMAITSDLNQVLEKLKRHLSDNVRLESWLVLMVGGTEGCHLPVEKEWMGHIIKGVLGS
jgi:hypothetical protein